MAALMLANILSMESMSSQLGKVHSDYKKVLCADFETILKSSSFAKKRFYTKIKSKIINQLCLTGRGF